MACALIFLMLFVAGMIGYGARNSKSSVSETCFIVYWQENDWIRRLKTAAGDSGLQQSLRIEVLPVTHFTDADGIIRYPPGTHSIQLRPVETSGANSSGWHVWYWYAGNDPSALFPYAHWFQKVTHEFFADGLYWQEQVSPLSPQWTLFGESRNWGLNTSFSPGKAGFLLVWMCLFFTTGHLSKLSLSQTVCEHTYLSLVVTPAGWHSPVNAIRIFYGVLAMVIAAAAAAMLKPRLLMNADFWYVTLCATLIYLGVGLTIAACCRSVASAGLGTIIYLTGAGVLYALATQLPFISESVPSGFVSAEAALFSVLDPYWNSGTPAFDGVARLAPLFWAIVWSIISERSLRQIRPK